VTHPYPVLGLEVPTLRGRQKIFEQVCRGLTKPTPDHISVVGPKYFGKTVLAHALAAHFRKTGSPYAVVCLWDLRHETPTDDAAFVRSLAKILDTQLLKLGHNKYHEYLDAGAGGKDTIGMIQEVAASLESDRVGVLIILDDFDRLAQETRITKNLWDFLRSLAQRTNLQFLTTSRKGLRESIPSKESLSSDFWNIFSNKVVLSPFDQQAIDEVVQPLIAAGYSVDPSAKKEILNWSGGVPILAIGLCRAIMDSIPAGPVSKPQVDKIAEGFPDTHPGCDVLDTFWDDCDHETQCDIIDLAASHVLESLPERRRRPLLERGYVVVDGERVRPSCRLVTNHAAKRGHTARDFRDLFRDEISERRAMKAILELKLAQVDTKYTELKEFVRHSINGLSSEGRVALTAIRSVADEALTVAWVSEFPGNVLPAAVSVQLTLGWDQGGGGLKPAELGNLGNPNTRRRILSLAAGDQGRRKVTRRISRPTMLLIQHLHRLGDFGQHMPDVPPEQEARVDFTFCAVACFAAISLLKRLSEDLATP
jgi:Cdc6-like AAA superfamily ATPase